MNWTKLLNDEIEMTYGTTAGLLDKVDPNSLEWKPESGSNWMTVGQLLKHISDGCGAACKAFVTNDWGLPEGKSMQDLSPEEMLPPAEKLPAVASVEEARKLLAEDKKVALRMVEQAGEKDLDTKETVAPWAPNARFPLG